MTAQEYANMYRAVPTRHGLAAVGQAFQLEATDRAKALHVRDEVEAVGVLMQSKWRAFCELVSDLNPQPQPSAFDGLTAMLLQRRGF